MIVKDSSGNSVDTGAEYAPTNLTDNSGTNSSQGNQGGFFQNLGNNLISKPVGGVWDALSGMQPGQQTYGSQLLSNGIGGIGGMLDYIIGDKSGSPSSGSPSSGSPSSGSPSLLNDVGSLGSRFWKQGANPDQADPKAWNTSTPSPKSQPIPQQMPNYGVTPVSQGSPAPDSQSIQPQAIPQSPPSPQSQPIPQIQAIPQINPYDRGPNSQSMKTQPQAIPQGDQRSAFDRRMSK